MLICLVIREKKAAIRGDQRMHGIYQWVLHTPHDSKPAWNVDC